MIKPQVVLGWIARPLKDFQLERAERIRATPFFLFLFHSFGCAGFPKVDMTRTTAMTCGRLVSASRQVLKILVQFCVGVCD